MTIAQQGDPAPLTVLRGAQQRYAWGSESLIQQLCGVVPDGRPLAELWFGAHPAATTMTDSGEASLQARIEADAAGELGPKVTGRHGDRLPYLLKLLAAAEPLSMQVHPSVAQAVAGYAAEDVLGIDRQAPNRSFRDANHKPELIAAITQFEAMVGFRSVTETVEFLSQLNVAALRPLIDLLQTRGLGSALREILTLAPEPVNDLVEAVAVACTEVDGKWEPEAELLVRLHAKYPGDAGVLTAALLNRIVLQPGEAVYLDAGNLHAYVSGLGVEIMASSDNVLRGGLTVKHMDVTALLDVVVAEPMDPDVLTPTGLITEYATPAPEFALTRYERPEEAVRVLEGPEMVLCVGGTASVRSGDTVMEITSGDAVWCSARAREIVITASDLVFVAAVGS